MTEIKARRWLLERFGGARRTTLDRFAELLVDETSRQNLIAPSTSAHLWARHMVDSAQLLLFAPAGWRHWVDIGTGAGFPGLVIAALCDAEVTMIEPRKLRASFLARCIAELDLPNARVSATSAHHVLLSRLGDVISARAVAPLGRLFELASPLATSTATYILPKGANARDELSCARRAWSGVFHVEPSIVDPSSGIVVARQVERR